MSVSDQNTIGQSAMLGEKLLKVLPAQKSGQSKPRVSFRELFARLQILGAADTLGFLALLVLLAALCGTGVLFLLNSEAKIVEQRSYLRWRGIEATLKLAQSPNSKVVVIGNSATGLPLILDTATNEAIDASASALTDNAPSTSLDEYSRNDQVGLKESEPRTTSDTTDVSTGAVSAPPAASTVGSAIIGGN